MTASEFIPLLLIASMLAGLVGSLTGLGGGVVLTPLLVFGFGVDLKYAIGASIVAIVATSCGSAVKYVRDGFVNVRVATLLECATVIGAIVGAWAAGFAPKGVIAVVFGVAAVWSAYGAVRPPAPRASDPTPDPLSSGLKLDNVFPGEAGVMTPYRVRRLPAGLAVMLVAGVLSALVGIGAGILKVLAMDRLMGLPFKVSTTTSNFMVGVTGAASAGMYLHRGQIEPVICGPVAIGAVAGSLMGARLLPGMNMKTLRFMFALAVGAAGISMIYRGLTGRV